MKPIALVTTKMRLRKSSSGRIGSLARRSTNGNATSSTTPDDEHRDDLGGAPRVGRATQAREEHDRREAAGEDRGTEVVDRVPDVLGPGVEGHGDHASATAPTGRLM